MKPGRCDMSDNLAENYKSFISEQLLLEISDALIILQLLEGQSGETEMLYLMKVNILEELYISVKEPRVNVNYFLLIFHLEKQKLEL